MSVECYGTTPSTSGEIPIQDIFLGIVIAVVIIVLLLLKKRG